MKVIVTTLSDEIYTLDISEELELKNLKAFVEFESGIPSSEFVLLHEGRPLFEDDRSLNFVGIKDGDIIVLQPIVQPGSAINGPSEDNPAYIRDMLLANLDQLALLKQNNPKLADALLSGNLDTFASVLAEQQESKKERERQRIRMLNADPFDVETQRLIADEIRQKNVDANMEAAMEHSPESFATVTMLYINCRVNGHPVKAFIDSGAQTTIMSAACAERCNIMRLVDHRWAGIAKGVGTQKIIGRVHMGQIQIENNFLLSSFSILEQQPMDMLLGLDMLKRHQCTIDLKSNQLKIGTTGTVTRFLSENELPDCARLNIQNEDEILKLSRQQEEDKALAEALEASARQAGGSCSSQTNPSASMAATHNFPEGDVQELMLLGFSRDQVLIQLTKFKGDKKNATAALFANVFGNAFNQSKQN